MDNEQKRLKKKPSIRLIFLIIGVLLVVFCAAGMIFFYNKYQDIKNDPDLIAKQEATMLLEDIGRLMVLPTGEIPTVATVTDSDKLASQVFFKDSKNGDKLLAYTIAKRAILYRPSAKKIINIAPFNIDASSMDDAQQ